MAPLVVTRTLHIAAHRSAVWAALTEAHLIAEWFGDQATIDLRVGGAGTLTWDKYGTSSFVIEEVDEPNVFAFRWPHGMGEHQDSDPTTLVRFTLADAEGGTQLTVVETGWEAFDDNADEFMNDNVGGWQSELDELRDFLEKQDSL
ncbi:MAG TPA: SRPBCC domain-containing protein [Galbitalea sp.]|jgi:uncharacterized protein YndB with AHSA1/START domain|nr:SRPBCC domain-containing protein [Galbitalea sp.]